MSDISGMMKKHAKEQEKMIESRNQQWKEYQSKHNLPQHKEEESKPKLKLNPNKDKEQEKPKENKGNRKMKLKLNNNVQKEQQPQRKIRNNEPPEMAPIDIFLKENGHKTETQQHNQEKPQSYQNLQKEDTTQHKKQKQEKFVHEQIKEQNPQNKVTKDDFNDEEEKFRRSETPMHLKSRWIEIYRQAKSSNKTGSMHDKFVNGRFTFTSTGEVTLLPDMDTSGMTVDEMLRNGQWKQYED